MGLRLSTGRGEVLKGILEGVTFYLAECVQRLPEVGVEIQGFRAVGGGSKSDAWLQLSADILDRPFHRPAVTEAGALGAAVMAASGCGAFSGIAEGSEAMVRLAARFDPDPARHDRYAERLALYRELYPRCADVLRRV